MNLRKTTVVLPKDLLDRAKIFAIQEGISLSNVIKRSLENNIIRVPTNSGRVEDSMKTLGVLQIGIKNLYKKRSELYENK